MSEPARKRRMFGHPQWGQTPSLSSQSFSGSEFTFTSDATTGTSYSADSSTFPNLDPFPTDTLPLDVFSYDYPIVTAQGLPVTEAAPLPFDSIPPLLHLHSDAQTQFSGPSNASLDPSLPTQHEVWQNHQGPPDAPLLTEEPNYDIDVSSTLPLDDIWRNTSLYRLDGGMSFESRPVVSTSDIWSRKRDFDRVSDGLGSTAVSQTTNDLLRAALPSLFPSLPDIRSRQARSFVANPFLDCLENSYPTLANRVRPVIPENGVINGYIKIRLCSVQEDETNAAVARVPFFRSQRREAAITPDDGGPLAAAIPLLPPNFSTGMKLDRTDEKLWCFHINAYCPGRTLLPGNFWCDQVAAVAVKSECARHALLAFTTTYILDYEPTKLMEKRAKHHYRKAVQLLDEALKREETYSVGHDDGVVVAIILIISNDIVNWESRRPPGIEPLWREGARAARLVLDRADPGYRYWNPQNVQSSLARIGGANWIASTEICAQPVAPLSEEQTTNLFPWLLEGSKEDIHKIQGVTGVCPKLLHIFSQITHLAALLKKDPDSTIVPLAALKVRNRLAKFWQWSDDSFVYSSGDELMKSCVLDEDGKVNDPAMVTALSAYAWVPAAEMYLHMRVYRKPRSHAHVVRSLKRLVMCIERLPCTGPLFTSQSPFFPVFLMAVAAVQDEDRKVVRDWFEVVLNGASCRSNVPPVWTAIKNLWKWLDNDLKEESYDEDQPIGDRRAWWEEMVDELVRVNGILSLV